VLSIAVALWQHRRMQRRSDTAQAAESADF
jgi:hypothetical protein